MPIVEMRGVSRIYRSGDHILHALDNVDLSIDAGKFVVILGQSGAGKSTLLNLLGGLDSPSKGTITVDGQDISTLTGNELADYRATRVGFVFQFYNLIPTLSALENVALVKEIAPHALDAAEVLDEVGLSDHLHQFPQELSGGEQQRVSIARAVAKNPDILLCDEPTGALDSETGVMVPAVLQMARDHRKTIIIVTHNQNIAKMADVVIRLRSGRVVSCQEQAHPSAPMKWSGDMLLFKKTLRTMGRYKAQFISMAVMVMIGAGVFLGFHIEWRSIEKTVQQFLTIRVCRLLAL